MCRPLRPVRSSHHTPIRIDEDEEHGEASAKQCVTCRGAMQCFLCSMLIFVFLGRVGFITLTIDPPQAHHKSARGAHARHSTVMHNVPVRPTSISSEQQLTEEQFPTIPIAQPSLPNPAATRNKATDIGLSRTPARSPSPITMPIHSSPSHASSAALSRQPPPSFLPTPPSPALTSPQLPPLPCPDLVSSRRPTPLLPTLSPAPPQMREPWAGEASSKVCLVSIRAEGVYRRNEDQYGTTDLVLFLYDGEGHDAMVQKTKPAMNTVNPTWEEQLCVPIAEQSDHRLCFEIRDDFDPSSLDDHQPILHSGCVPVAHGWGSYTIPLSKGATLVFSSHPSGAPFPPLTPPAPHMPTLPPSPSPAPPMDVVEKLNARFHKGSPSNNLEEVGLIIHQFDSLDDPNPDNQPWLPRRPTISAAAINGRLQPEPDRGNVPVYSYSLAGIILAPEYNRIRCSYAFDAGTLQFPNACNSQRCSNREAVDTHASGGCAFNPWGTQRMMEIQLELRRRNVKPQFKAWDDHKFYNELVMDDQTYTHNLPKSIEAVFFIPTSCDDIFDGPKCEAYARGAHRNILRHFQLTEAQLPLVKFDFFNWERPLTYQPNCDLAAKGVFSCTNAAG